MKKSQNSEAKLRKKYLDKEAFKMAKIKVTLAKSTIGAPARQRKVVEALGLKKMHQSVELEDNSVSRGAVAKVSHLVTVEEV